jgi:RNA polymerase sigma-70 factor (ECF subfamily)
MSAGARTDEELMMAYVGGSDAAFGELFRRYAPVLVRVIQRQIGRAADAQDVAQQTFLQLHRARHDFRPSQRLRPWIMTIALNLSRDLMRRRGRRPETSMKEDTLPLRVAVQPVADAAGDDPETFCACVRSAVSSLPREQREVIELHWFERLSFTEIAAIVGATSGAARVRAHRGYLELRKRLDPANQGFPQQA